MRAVVVVLAVAAATVVAGCSPAPNAILVEGSTTQLVSGYYSVSLANCAGANTFVLTDRQGVGETSKTEISTSASRPYYQGGAWLPAGTYSGEALNEKVAPCFGLCLGQITSSHQVSGCGWSLKLNLVRAGTR